MKTIKELLSKKRDRSKKAPDLEIPPLPEMEQLFQLGCKHGYVDAVAVVYEAIEAGEDPLEALARRSGEVLEKTMQTSRLSMQQALEQANNACSG